MKEKVKNVSGTEVVDLSKKEEETKAHFVEDDVLARNSMEEKE